MNEANTIKGPAGADWREPESVEAEIQRKGLTAPRITPLDMERNIASVHYFTAAEGVFGANFAKTVANNESGSEVTLPDCGAPLGLLTICVLVLRNGFTVHGVSACASPENFNADIGQRIARENAVREMWPLMGYQLRDKLYNQALGDEAFGED